MAATMETTKVGSSLQHGMSTGGAVLVRGEHIHHLRDSEVCALIDAAGPLALRDLACGLNLPLPEVAACVSRMANNGSLLQDEWERYRTAA